MLVICGLAAQPSQAKRRFGGRACRRARVACCCPPQCVGGNPQAGNSKEAVGTVEPGPAWRPLFDGKTLANWKPTIFGGQGDVTVKDGAIQMEFGYSMSGITYSGKEPLPKANYELSLEAQRVDGIDFFCGLTFPVEESHCSLIVGGWAGAIVGLSNIDGSDASENDTTSFMEFDSKKWYRIRVRVTEDFITAWIDDKQVVKQEVKGHRINIRPEMDLSCPLGIATWETKSALRNIRIRELPANGD